MRLGMGKVSERSPWSSPPPGEERTVLQPAACADASISACCPCLAPVLNQRTMVPLIVWLRTQDELFFLHPFHSVINTFFNVQPQRILNKLFCNTSKSLCKLFVNTFQRPPAIKYYFIIFSMPDI